MIKDLPPGSPGYEAAENLARPLYDEAFDIERSFPTAEVEREQAMPQKVCAINSALFAARDLGGILWLLGSDAERLGIKGNPPRIRSWEDEGRR
jgi:hypothetical protein